MGEYIIKIELGSRRNFVENLFPALDQYKRGLEVRVSDLREVLMFQYVVLKLDFTRRNTKS